MEATEDTTAVGLAGTPDRGEHHPELQRLRVQLKSIYEAMDTFGPTVARPPVLDSSIKLNGGPSTDRMAKPEESIVGLRALRDAVRRDLDVLEKFLADEKNADLPALSTNAPYLIAVWHEVLLAPPPITAIWTTYADDVRPAQTRKRGSPGVKVDVVADDGRQWIRVNTMKNSRMLAELREFDSYMTEFEDESDSDSDSGRPVLAQIEPNHSLLRMGRGLLAAAQQNLVPGTNVLPHVVLRLTRLDPASDDEREQDPRIAMTVQALRDTGIEVQLGERDPASLPLTSASPPPPPRLLEPTSRVNLDLSILIALVSDITHAPLPLSTEEAEGRFVPPQAYREWKMERIKATKGAVNENADGPELDFVDGAGKHTRALAHQARQEMKKGLLQEIYDRLAALPELSPHGSDLEHPLARVEFWITPEARDRCLKIVLSKIGGVDEKRRVRALFFDSLGESLDLAQAEGDYWLHSRYPRGFIPLLPIRVFPASEPPKGLEQGKPQPPDRLCGDAEVMSPFFRQLGSTCRDLLAQGTMENPSVLPAGTHETLGTLSQESQLLSGDAADGADADIQRASILRANPKLTTHTVQSLLWGAHRGWTTLTANKTSVKAIVRETKAFSRVGGATAMDDRGEQSRKSGSGSEKAALWVVDPRSLAEGMRSDYKP